MAYTKEQEAVLTKTAETEGRITYAMAEDLAAEFGVTHRSVIAKVKSMELPYEPKPVAPKRPKGKTKSELVEEIVAALGGEVDLVGLEKATGRALAKLSEAVAK